MRRGCEGWIETAGQIQTLAKVYGIIMLLSSRIFHLARRANVGLEIITIQLQYASWEPDLTTIEWAGAAR